MRAVDQTVGQANVQPLRGSARSPGSGTRVGLRDPSVRMFARRFGSCRPGGGAQQRLILFDALGIMLCIVVPTVLATLAFAWWFRASNPKAQRRPDWAFSGKIEIVTWSVPFLTIVFLGGIAWQGSHDLDPAKPLETRAGDAASKALEVQVVSLDWKWLFIYPDLKLASLNRLVIPTHVPIHFTLTSASVMNTFFVPQLGSMIYVMNGMADQLNLQADRAGTFPGLSGHYSGDGFLEHALRRRGHAARRFRCLGEGRKAALGPRSTSGVPGAVPAEPRQCADELPLGLARPVRCDRVAEAPARARPEAGRFPQVR